MSRDFKNHPCYSLWTQTSTPDIFTKMPHLKYGDPNGKKEFKCIRSISHTIERVYEIEPPIESIIDEKLRTQSLRNRSATVVNPRLVGYQSDLTIRRGKHSASLAPGQTLTAPHQANEDWNIIVQKLRDGDSSTHLDLTIRHFEAASSCINKQANTFSAYISAVMRKAEHFGVDAKKAGFEEKSASQFESVQLDTSKLAELKGRLEHSRQKIKNLEATDIYIEFKALETELLGLENVIPRQKAELEGKRHSLERSRASLREKEEKNRVLEDERKNIEEAVKLYGYRDEGLGRGILRAAFTPQRAEFYTPVLTSDEELQELKQKINSLSEQIPKLEKTLNTNTTVVRRKKERFAELKPYFSPVQQAKALIEQDEQFIIKCIHLESERLSYQLVSGWEALEVHVTRTYNDFFGAINPAECKKEQKEDQNKTKEAQAQWESGLDRLNFLYTDPKKISQLFDLLENELKLLEEDLRTPSYSHLRNLLFPLNDKGRRAINLEEIKSVKESFEQALIRAKAEGIPPAFQKINNSVLFNSLEYIINALGQVHFTREYIVFDKIKRCEKREAPPKLKISRPRLTLLMNDIVHTVQQRPTATPASIQENFVALTKDLQADFRELRSVELLLPTSSLPFERRAVPLQPVDRKSVAEAYRPVTRFNAEELKSLQQNTTELFKLLQSEFKFLETLAPGVRISVPDIQGRKQKCSLVKIEKNLGEILQQIEIEIKRATQIEDLKGAYGGLIQRINSPTQYIMLVLESVHSFIEKKFLSKAGQLQMSLDDRDKLPSSFREANEAKQSQIQSHIEKQEIPQAIEALRNFIVELGDQFDAFQKANDILLKREKRALKKSKKKSDSDSDLDSDDDEESKEGLQKKNEDLIIIYQPLPVFKKTLSYSELLDQVVDIVNLIYDNCHLDKENDASQKEIIAIKNKIAEDVLSMRRKLSAGETGRIENEMTHVFAGVFRLFLATKYARGNRSEDFIRIGVNAKKFLLIEESQVIDFNKVKEVWADMASYIQEIVSPPKEDKSSSSRSSRNPERDGERRRSLTTPPKEKEVKKDRHSSRGDAQVDERGSRYSSRDERKKEARREEARREDRSSGRSSGHASRKPERNDGEERRSPPKRQGVVEESRHGGHEGSRGRSPDRDPYSPTLWSERSRSSGKHPVKGDSGPQKLNR